MALSELKRPSKTQLKNAWLKGSVYFGIYLLNIWSGTTMFWGNLSVYTSSYFYSRVTDPGEVQSPWPVSFFLIFLSLGVIIAKPIFDRIGRRITCLTGILIVNTNIFLSYFAVQHSIMTLALTLGVGMGIGAGINNSIMMVSIVDWTDTYVKLAISSLLASTSLGSTILNQVITFYINPHNLSTDRYNGKIRYFSQPEILDRVPRFFLVFGSTSLALNLLGFILLKTERKLSKDKDAIDATKKLLEEDTMTCKSMQNSTNKQNNRSSNFVEKPKERRQENGYCVSESRQTDLINSPDVDYTPRQMLKTFSFYVMSLFIMFTDLGYLTVTSYYKTFGLLYISDDHFLTNIGSVLVFAIALSSLASGFATENIKVKTAFVGSASVLTIISSFYYFTPMVSKWMFGLITVVYSGVIYFNYCLFMVATFKMFGETHYSTNYGIASLSGIIVNMVAPPLINFIISNLGWYYVFFSVGVGNAISLILVMVGFPSI